MKTRDSNMELLRIIAMVFIVLLHTNAQMMDKNEYPFYLVWSLGIISVNLYVLVSGWYGIRFNVKKLCALLFQALFFSLLFLSAQFAFGDKEHVLSTFIDIITLRHFWFLRAYILLMIMAPALNLLAEHSSKGQFGTILILFFLFQTIFSYINNSPWYQDGFSVLPFFGLYLLARYLRIYGNPIPNKYISFILYLLVSAILAAIALLLMIRFGTQGRMFNYTNPLVILSSILLFLCFTAFRFESRFVNWVASSVFAVYLFHMNPFFFDNYFIKTIQPWSGDSFLLFEGKSLLFIIVIFIAAILLDKVRMWLWQRLLSETPFNRLSSW